MAGPGPALAAYAGTGCAGVAGERPAHKPEVASTVADPSSGDAPRIGREVRARRHRDLEGWLPRPLGSHDAGAPRPVVCGAAAGFWTAAIGSVGSARSVTDRESLPDGWGSRPPLRPGRVVQRPQTRRLLHQPARGRHTARVARGGHQPGGRVGSRLRRDHKEIPAAHVAGEQQQFMRVLLVPEPAHVHHVPGDGHLVWDDRPLVGIDRDPGDPPPQRIQYGGQGRQFRPEIAGARPPGAVQQSRRGAGGSQRQTQRGRGEPVIGLGRRRAGNGRSHDANPAPGQLEPARNIQSPKTTQA